MVHTTSTQRVLILRNGRLLFSQIVDVNADESLFTIHFVGWSQAHDLIVPESDLQHVR